MARKPDPVADRMGAGYFRLTEHQPSEHLDSKTAEHLNTMPAEQPKRVKRTYYLSADADRLLKRVQFARYEETGKQPELSELVEEAILAFAS